MKVSEVFTLPLACIYDEDGVPFQVVDPYNDLVIDGESTCDETNYEVIVQAINNHDRLTEENAKLREVLERLVNPDNCKKDIIHVIGNAESILNQLKDQNNEK